MGKNNKIQNIKYLLVVGLGASAGGIGSAQEIFQFFIGRNWHGIYCGNAPASRQKEQPDRDTSERNRFKSNTNRVEFKV